MRVAINGFGRIGRTVFRILEETEGVDVVAVNDLFDYDTLRYLLNYDTIMGPFGKALRLEDDHFITLNTRARLMSEKNPADLPWAEMGIDAVVECTGVFRKRAQLEQHLAAGAKRVILTVPAAEPIDYTVVLGVNDVGLLPEHRIISNASCTTNCFVPLVKVLDDAFGLEKGLMTTIHAYTGDQNIVDGPHSDLRRARAAAVNIIPTSTGAARATSLVMQSMAGKLDGTAIRVPVPTGSLTDFTAVLASEPSAADINAAYEAAATEGRLAGVLDYSTAPLVSSDIVGAAASCTFDSGLTMAIGNLVKVSGWYDNEWGYSNRLVDLIGIVGKA